MHRLPWVLGAFVAVGALFGGWLIWSRSSTSTEKPFFPLPPYSTTRYLNTGPETRYIGAAACAECHPKQHRSYLLTPHSRALADVDPKSEPPDGALVHPRTRSRLRTYRKDGQIRQEDVVATDDGKEIARTDLPLRYLVGSGHFTRTYLVEIDGFLQEAPLTWYGSRNKWDLSPGYDAEKRWSFDRPVLIRCLSCHAGHVEHVGETIHRLKITEKSIGCESCHGPGSLHQEKHRGKKRITGEEDLTIVHPGRLPRRRLESICASCHLSGVATIPLRGRQITDFRPGRPLTDYRIDYQFAAGSEQMTVVGHVEQLRRSVCYQKSEELTCVTCHDPHAREKPKDKVAFSRGKCLSCHDSTPCSEPIEQRRKKAPGDNCAACHMPVGDTDIPHVAFTHHRIGRPSHDKSGGEAAGAAAPELVPIDDVELPAIDRDRNLGLAYREAYRLPENLKYGKEFGERARVLLEKIHEAGLRDGEALESLAQIYDLLKDNPQRSKRYALEALEVKEISNEAKVYALISLARSELKEEDFEAAVPVLEDLGRRRRNAEDWRLLGVCYEKLGQHARALSALKQSLAIRPDRILTHRGLEEVYRRLGNFRRAEEHRTKAEWLERHRPE